MAKREENLKKINAELEQLSDEELEKVAGGNAQEMAADSRFLNTLLAGRPGQCDRYGNWTIGLSLGCYDEEIKAAWRSVGINAIVDQLMGGFGKHNTYFHNGQELTQEEARQHAMNFVGKQLKKSDWNW